MREARRVTAEARTRAQALRRSGRANARRQAARILAAAERLETLAERSDKIVQQIRKRPAGEPIRDRLVSLFDPDACPIRKGKLRAPTEFGFVEQLAEVTTSTRPGVRGFLLPPASAPGNPGENELLPTTVAELQRLGLSPREVSLDAASRRTRARRRSPGSRPTGSTSPGVSYPARNAHSAVSPATAAEPKAGSRTSNAATACGATASKAEKRTWTGWAAFAYNVETYGRYA